MRKLITTLIVPALFILFISGCASQINGNMPQGQSNGNGIGAATEQGLVENRQYERGREDYPGQNYASMARTALSKTERNTGPDYEAGKNTGNATGNSSIKGTQLSASAGEYPNGSKIVLKSIKTPVRQGETGSLSILGIPNTQYTITAVYKSAGDVVTSTVVKLSGTDGMLGLEWNVGMQTVPGTYGIMIAGGGDQITASYTVIGQE